MRRDRRRQKRGERLGAVLGLLTGGIGGFLNQIRQREATALKERELEQELDLKEEELDLERKKQYATMVEGNLKLLSERARDKVRAARSEMLNKKSEADIELARARTKAAALGKQSTRGKTALAYQAEGIAREHPDLDTALAKLRERLSGVKDQDPSSLGALFGMPSTAPAERRNIEQIMGYLRENAPSLWTQQGTPAPQMPTDPQRPGMIGPPTNLTPQEQGRGPMGQQYGPPMPSPTEMVGANDGSETGGLVGAMLDAWNPKNPPEVRDMGFARLLRYFGPSAVLQSFRDRQGGPPVPQMPR